MDAARAGLAVAAVAFALLAVLSAGAGALSGLLPGALLSYGARGMILALALAGLGLATAGRRDVLGVTHEPWWLVVGGLLVGALALHPDAQRLRAPLALVSGAALHLGLATFAAAPLRGPARWLPWVGAGAGILGVYLQVAFEAGLGALEAVAMGAYALAFAFAFAFALRDMS